MAAAHLKDGSLFGRRRIATHGRTEEYTTNGKARPMKSRERSDTETRRVEKRLIVRARRGDTSALRELAESHQDRLFAFVRRMIRNHHDAEELVQDAFLKAFASLDSFSTQYRFSTWLFTIAYRLSLNALRKKQALTGDLDFGTLRDPSPSCDGGVAQSDEARHMKDLIWRSVDRLSPPQRATLVLFYQHDKSCQQIAQVLELPVATVKSHLHRARAKLRALLESVVHGESSNARILRDLAG